MSTSMGKGPRETRGKGKVIDMSEFFDEVFNHQEGAGTARAESKHGLDSKILI